MHDHPAVNGDLQWKEENIMEQIKLRVPATSANLGPGFDCLGCAFKLYNTFLFEPCSGYSFKGVEEPYRNEDNLAVIGYKRVMEYLEQPPVGFHMELTDCQIPICRGLGSSSTLILAGAYAANLLHNGGLSREELLEICTGIEGHPDNLAPAVYGGLTGSMMFAGKPVTVRYTPNPALTWVAMVPDFELSTQKARQVLPTQVSREDAIFNVSRASILLGALEQGDEALLALAMDDRLHQNYRKPLIPEYEEVEQIVLEEGFPAMCLSGAGPTLLTVTRHGGDIANLRRRLKALQGGWKVQPLQVDMQGVTVD